MKICVALLLGPFAWGIANAALAIDIGLDLNHGSPGQNEWTAWVNGHDPCDGGEAHSLHVNQPNNPCGHPFVIPQFAGSFTFEGCGGNVWINQNGAFAGNCRWAPNKQPCVAGSGFAGQWQCILD
ncbi:hypothetical protein GQ53DRAFT_430679 [Thozetella sp. PMI_491]|nr:hypothetical protein GQ53DRAFT_430679 [Thozetella sp. PMI_491]